jgi:hypothetical protein
MNRCGHITARQCKCKYISAATDSDATIKELLEAVFSTQSMPRP